MYIQYFGNYIEPYAFVFIGKNNKAYAGCLSQTCLEGLNNCPSHHPFLSTRCKNCQWKWSRHKHDNPIPCIKRKENTIYKTFKVRASDLVICQGWKFIHLGVLCVKSSYNIINSFMLRIIQTSKWGQWFQVHRSKNILTFINKKVWIVGNRNLFKSLF